MRRLNKKYKRELNFWVDKWAKKLEKGWWSDDIKSLLNIHGDPGRFSCAQRRVQEARALFLRVFKETRIRNKAFFKYKVVVDIGPGPMGFLEASDAKIKIAIEPLAGEFRKHNLLLKKSDVIYLTTPAENIPLLDGSVDIVLSRNSLDHSSNPHEVAKEIVRILKRGGYFILNVDINHPAMIAEPHRITQRMIEAMTKDFKLIRKMIYKKPHGWKGQMFIGLFRKAFSSLE